LQLSNVKVKTLKILFRKLILFMWTKKVHPAAPKNWMDHPRCSYLEQSIQLLGVKDIRHIPLSNTEMPNKMDAPYAKFAVNLTT
jgi:hypothetical protein